MAKTYSEKLRDPRWQRMRLEIMGRDSFRCRLCGDAESTLNVHHIYYERGAEPWDYPESALVTVCENCHEDLTVSRFGDCIVEAAIVGGITRDALYGLMYAFQMCLSDGPKAAPLSPEQWEGLTGAVIYSIGALQRGATEGEIREALEAIPHGQT